MYSLHLILPLPVPLDALLDGSGKSAPSLIAMTRRGYQSDLAPSLSSLCCQAFAIDKQWDWPVAPLTAKADGLDAGEGYWLRIDPVHLEVGMGGLMLQPPQRLALAREEAEALTASINAHWRDEGLEIHAASQTRWHLRLPEAPDLSTTPLDRVEGEYLTPYLPTGGDANRLMRLVNVAQMLMHEHPVNQARERDGRLIANGLWLWGGGTLPLPAVRNIGVASDHAEVRALAEAVRLRPDAESASWRNLASTMKPPRVLATLSPGPDDHALEDFLARLERDWFKPLLRDLALARVRRIRVDLLARPGRSFSLVTSQAWRFWRRSAREDQRGTTA